MIDGVDTSAIDPTVDRGDRRDTRTEKPCLKRFVLNGQYGFCQLPDGHERERNGEPGVGCIAVYLSDPPPPNDFGPKAATATRRGR